MVETGKKALVIAGPAKIPAIKAALAAKAFNLWITEQHSAYQRRDIAANPISNGRARA